MESDANNEAGAAKEFLAVSMRLRCSAQQQYAEKALERLNEIAMKGDRGPVQVSALRELLEEVLGRPISPVALPAKQDEDSHAVIAASGARLREKLDRIAKPVDSQRTDSESDG